MSFNISHITMYVFFNHAFMVLLTRFPNREKEVSKCQKLASKDTQLYSAHSDKSMIDANGQTRRLREDAPSLELLAAACQFMVSRMYCAVYYFNICFVLFIILTYTLYYLLF